MKALVPLFLACVTLTLTGCPAYSVHPLYTNEDAIVEPALEGSWVDTSEDPTEFSFRKSAEHEYSMTMSDPKSKIVQNYTVNLVRLGDQMFMDIVFKDQAVNDTKIDDPIGTVPCHIIVKVNIAGDDLAYAVMDDDPIQKQGPLEKPPLGYVTTDEGPLVTAETDALRRYVSTDKGDAFPNWEHLTRKHEIQP